MAGLLSDSQVASMAETVATAFDQTLPIYRKTTTSDGYGHTIETYPGTTTETIDCNIIKPSATMLANYASIIGSQRTVILRVLTGTDVREGDRVVYDSLNWQVQKLMDTSSYTVTKQYLISVIV